MDVRKRWPASVVAFERALKRYDSRLFLVRGLSPLDRQAIAAGFPVKEKLRYWMAYRKVHGGSMMQHAYTFQDPKGRPRDPSVDHDMPRIYRDHVSRWLNGRKPSKVAIEQWKREVLKQKTPAELDAEKQREVEEIAREYTPAVKRDLERL